MMRIFTILCFILAFGWFLNLSAGSLHRERDAEQPVNILILVSDDQRSDAVGYAGNETIQTPNLDRLAGKGTSFANAFVTTPICCASRAGILTGQLARSTGVYDFSTPVLLTETYPSYLKESGYYTGFIGKWGISDSDKGFFSELCGFFDFWGGSMNQSNYWHERTCNYVNNNGTTEKHNFYCDCPPDSRGVSGEGVRIGNANMKDPVHLSTYVIPHKVEQFLDQRDKDKPFCLSVSFKAPHAPRDYDPAFRNAYKEIPMPCSKSVDAENARRQPDFLKNSLNYRDGNIDRIKDRENLNGSMQNSVRNYYRLINGLDSAVGEIVGMLQERKLFDNTVILFLSDNGYFLLEHGFSGKWLMYEESLRVPFFIFDPRNPGNGEVSEELVLNIDVAPTVLDLAGLPVPPQMQGKSLLELVHNPDKMFRKEIFAEHHYRFQEGHRHIERSECLRTKEWKYINYIDQTGTTAEELYNLADDPCEMQDLSETDKYSHILERLRMSYHSFLNVESMTVK